MSADQAVISVDNMRFEYSGVRVLHDVSCKINKGDIVALVGPNGAGKSTFMRAIAGLDAPIDGDINVMGINVLDDPRRAHEKMGYLSDFFGLFDPLTVEQHLKYMAGCHKIPASKAKIRIAEVLKLTGLTKRKGDLAGALSRGYRQRLGVAMTLLHEPDIVLLDEPASGLDPEARVELSVLIKGLNAAGMTLIVSSHILAELEDYCTSMMVIRDGRIADHVYLDDAKTRSISKTIDVDFAYDGAQKTLKEYFDGHEDIVSHSFNADGETGSCEVRGDMESVKAILRALVKTDAGLYAFAPHKNSLQSHYLKLAKGAAEAEPIAEGQSDKAKSKKSKKPKSGGTL